MDDFLLIDAEFLRTVFRPGAAGKSDVASLESLKRASRRYTEARLSFNFCATPSTCSIELLSVSAKRASNLARRTVLFHVLFGTAMSVVARSCVVLPATRFVR